MFRRQRPWFPRFLLLALVISPSVLLAEDTLIPPGSVWKFHDEGDDLGTAWRFPSYDDSGWDSGPAKLGYGDNDVVTEVSFGPLEFFKYITTYFRHSFTVTNPLEYGQVTLLLRRDDGAVVYLNGEEVVRSNLPPLIEIETWMLAIENISGSDEDEFELFTVPAELLVTGENTLAVEVHQTSPFSSDLGLDLELRADAEVSVLRGPYLQNATPTSMVIRWRTDQPTHSKVWYGTSAGALESVVELPSFTTEHEVTLSGLTPQTTYYHAVGKSDDILGGGTPEHSFQTSPAGPSADPFRVWVLGDSGTANPDAAAVRDAYYGFNGGPDTDVWLMLGDNAYSSGTDSEYQGAVFDMYADTLLRCPLTPTRGNHEVVGSTFYEIFSFPSQGEAGGVPSFTEDYFSFDHGNAHFICLNSFELVNAFVGGPMWTWLAADLAANQQEWTIAYWHHPPYTKGSHDSDTEPKLIQMRNNFVPLLESGGVDLVLGGHSHCYERSYLINGHYGFSFSFDESTMLLDGGNGRPAEDGAYVKTPGPFSGTVYIVAGSSGKDSGGDFDHPAMFHAERILGSVVLDIAGNLLDGTFVDDQGNIIDTFRIEHLASSFVRGDIDQDGTHGLGDAVSLLGFLFVPGTDAPTCLDAADINDDASLNLADAVSLLTWLFAPTGTPPAAPFPGCGEDPSDDPLACGSFSGCP